MTSKEDKTDLIIEQCFIIDEINRLQEEIQIIIEQTNLGFVRQLSKMQSKDMVRRLARQRKELLIAKRNEISRSAEAIKQDGQLKGQTPEWIRARIIYKKKEIIQKYLPRFQKIKNKILDLNATL